MSATILGHRAKRRCLPALRYGIAHTRSMITKARLNASDVPPTNPKASSTNTWRAWPHESKFASWTIGVPPNDKQLAYAKAYFKQANPLFLAGNSKFREIPVSTVPEVAFLGRSNVGKSSLLNALFNTRGASEVARTSRKAGATREMNAYGIHGVGWRLGAKPPGSNVAHHAWGGSGGLVVMDMPGYGQASRNDWGTEITKYLAGRKTLRRSFLLIDCEHGVKDSDLLALNVLKEHAVPYQIVLSKADKILWPRNRAILGDVDTKFELLDAAFQQARTRIHSIVRTSSNRTALVDDLIACSSVVDAPSGRQAQPIGLGNLQWAVLAACGLESDSVGKPRELEMHVQQTDTGQVTVPFQRASRSSEDRSGNPREPFFWEAQRTGGR